MPFQNQSHNNAALLLLPCLLFACSAEPAAEQQPAEAPAQNAAAEAKADAGELTVVSWGGSYGRATQQAILEPFSAETGVTTRLEDYNGGLAQIRAQVETGNVHWDVADLEMQDALRACDEGLLEPLPITEHLPAPDGTPAEQDFHTGTITDCGVGFSYSSHVVAYNPNHFEGEKPASVADFFDMQKFPGRRGMRRVGYPNLEMALLGDGVPPEQVYSLLSTPEGLQRAFDKLDSIKENIVWWETGAQPPQLLADGEVNMTIAYNGRIFHAQVVEKQPFKIIWRGQVLETTLLGIIAGGPNVKTAKQFVLYATSTVPQARLGNYISYSPTRKSGLALIGDHWETGEPMKPHMPTYPPNREGSLAIDWQWWSDHGEEINERFSAWLAH